LPGAALPVVVLVGGVAPRALALMVIVRRLIELESMARLAARTLRSSVASALSFKMATPKDAPTPTPVPDAAASAASVRTMLLDAATTTSWAAVSLSVEVPRQAST